MSTVITRIGPADQGRWMSLDEFEAAQEQPGYRYELIDGRVRVSPLPRPTHQHLLKWVYDHLNDYSRERPDAVNYVLPGSAVVVEARPNDTVPEPDVAAYRDYPVDAPVADWRDAAPVLVVEIVSPDNRDKDFVRNVDLYLAVPSIREYWIVEPGAFLSTTTLTVYRRRGQRWQRPIVVGPGETYTTRLLPGFTLIVDPLS